MDLRRKRIKKLQQLQKQPSSSSAASISIGTQPLEDAFLVSESDLIWWVSTTQTTTEQQLPATWLKDRLQELTFAQDSSVSASELAKMESAVKSLLAVSTKSDNTLCEELLDVLGYSDFAMALIPEIVSNRAHILRAAKKQSSQGPKSFIPGAGVGGGDPNRRTALPTGTIREWNDLKLTSSNAVVGRFEIVNVPATPAAPIASTDELIPVTRFGTLAQRAFSGITHLNRVQTRVFHSAYETNENLLIVAPTSAGKTNIAMTCIAREIETKGPLGVKCVYIAPMKALAQEIVEKFSKQLGSLHMTVRELTGDTQLTRSEMERTQVIVSTPEKWDVISRKGGDMVEMIHLLIIDEVHLVGDDRGPVVEALVARTIRQVERRQQMVRIVGLSATLPNYADLALFLRVNPERGLFYFDSSFRPVPLEQKFIGVSLENAPQPQQQQQQQQQAGKPLTQEEKQRMKTQGKAQRVLESAYNEICFDHAAQCVSSGNQVLVFVHTRKDTSRTARALLEIASSRRNADSEVFATNKQQDSPLRQQFARRVALSKNQDLQQLFAQGMGIHHAGMAREDRSLTEEMFTAGVISVLCCTSTLAWGVNLPSHLVIVKGTQIYAPDRGGICELNSADVFQCFGRAGRPQFDTSGEAILITEHGQLSRYLAMLTHTLPLESKLVQGLPDALNAEIVGGTVATVDEAMAWLSYTFFYVRMLKSPMQYGVAYDERKTDPNLDGARGKLISQTLRLLAEAKMVRIGVSSSQSARLGNAIFPGNTPLGTTDLGRVASNYYVSYQTVETLFNERIRKQMSIAELLDAICSSKEFDQLKVREEEQVEIRRLSSQACPFALEVVEDVRNPFDTPQAKTFILLQTYISRFPVDAFTLYSDMNYISQNAGRITRALFEVAVSKGWLQLALQTMQLSAALERQSWWYPMQHPLRQLAPVHVKPETVAVLENSDIDDGDWLVDRLLGTTEHVLAQRFSALNAHQAQRLLAACKLLPVCKVEVTQRQPVSAALLRLVVKITPQFTWREKIHGARQSYYLFVETGEDILHSERVSVSNNADGQIERTVVVPLFQHRVAQYTVRLESDSGWLDCGAVCTVNIADIQVPRETETQFTNLLPLDPLPITALKDPLIQQTLQFSHFNPIQTQCFHALYHGKHSLVISAPTSSGKTILAELAMWQVLFSSSQKKKTIVYVAPMKALVQERIMDWRSKFAHWNKSVVELTGDNSATQQELRNADLIVTTPEKFEVSTRFYHTAPTNFLHSVCLVVFDEIHLLGEDRGAALEAIVSRLKRMEHENPVRMIGLSATLANPSDVREWFGGASTVVYNFRSAVRAVPLEVHISGFPGAHYCPRMASMNKPIFHAIQQHATNKPVLVFVASRRQTRLTALDLISLCAATDNPRRFLHAEDFDVESIQDEAFRHCAQFGIALHHAGLSREDRERAELLFSSGACQVLIATATLAWGVNLPSYLVVIKGTEYFDAKTRTYAPFPVSDVLQMMGRAGRVQYGEEKGVAVLLVHDQLKAFYKRFLYEPFPLESNLVHRFAAYLNVEICAGRVRNVSSTLEYLASTFLALRVDKNPLYYGVERNVTVQTYFTQLVRTRLQHLVTNECCSADFTSLPLGVIAAKFDLEPETVKWMADRVRKGPKQTPTPSWVLETVTQTKDFDDIVVRANEEELNRTLAQALEWGAGTYSDLSRPNCKAFLLLQARMQVVKLPIHDYVTDSRQVEDIAARALPAFIRIVCALELSVQFCLDAMVLIGRLKSKQQQQQPAKQLVQQVTRQDNIVQCSISTSRADSDMWWCLSTADGKHVLAVERTTGNTITLELPAKWCNTLTKLQVTLVRENGTVVDSKEIA